MTQPGVRHQGRTRGQRDVQRYAALARQCRGHHRTQAAFTNIHGVAADEFGTVATGGLNEHRQLHAEARARARVRIITCLWLGRDEPGGTGKVPVVREMTGGMKHLEVHRRTAKPARGHFLATNYDGVMRWTVLHLMNDTIDTAD